MKTKSTHKEPKPELTPEGDFKVTSPEVEHTKKVEPKEKTPAVPQAKCMRCGSTKTVHTHHPKDGGPPEFICRPCHRMEHNQSPE